jgi:hypothetical protein
MNRRILDHIDSDSPGVGSYQSRSLRSVWIALLLLCVGSRLLTTIYYIADPDSLRFALSIIDYDIAKLQPHFPGYPVFCLVVTLVHAVTGSFALSFSVIGGVSVFVVLWATLGIMQEHPLSPRGALITFLIFFNPLIWLMSNRYMPDVMGLACCMATVYLLTRTSNAIDAVAGMFLAGILAGIRLSFLPFLIVPAVAVIIRGRSRWKLIVSAIAGVLVWLVPLMLITGWSELIAAARLQTTGHFNDFGGTIQTDSDLLSRTLRLVANIGADGLGFWWPERNWLTAIVAIGVGGCIAVGIWQHRTFKHRVIRIALVSWLVYLVWIFLFQNVIYQNRHVLPLLPFLLMAASWGAWHIIRRWGRSAIAAVAVALVAYGVVCAELVRQHGAPTAVAQVTQYLRPRITPATHIVTIPLIAYMLAAQGIDAIYHEVRLDTLAGPLVIPGGNEHVVMIGVDHGLNGRSPAVSRMFFHNPYVNRVWPRLSYHEYRRNETE